MKIERISQVDESTVEVFKKLMPQLTGKDKHPSLEELQRVIQSDERFLFFATENGEVIGTLTLVFYQLPSGLKAWIEDVIVDEQARGKGVATALLKHALQVAREKGALKADLTSMPWRQAANSLYQKMGFEKRESNMYRYHFTNNQ
ncbi:MAG: GNAT family N-acetyltransferase [Fermentimonas sp.]|jgi:GNAT superfamily N-acetyltransferase